MPLGTDGHHDTQVAKTTMSQQLICYDKHYVMTAVEEPESEVTPVTDGWQNVHTAKARGRGLAARMCAHVVITSPDKDGPQQFSADRSYCKLDENNDSAVGYMISFSRDERPGLLGCWGVVERMVTRALSNLLVLGSRS